MYKWYDIKLESVNAITQRLSVAKMHGWQDDFAYWSIVADSEQKRYEQIMSHIESNWNVYSDQAQAMYDASSLCYLLLGGKMIGVDTDAEIVRLKKAVYRKDN